MYTPWHEHAVPAWPLETFSQSKWPLETFSQSTGVITREIDAKLKTLKAKQRKKEPCSHA